MGRPGGTRAACAARTPRRIPPPLQGAGLGGGVTHVTNPSVDCKGTCMCKVKVAYLKPCLIAPTTTAIQNQDSTHEQKY